ncbi:hypothetical protein QCA50_010785 [Cerrena zonata]|uniref:Acyl-protein thioesterase 1 n=1 Tax=Cerrena zonata TaxID=2478898 RepID=A0AAW0GA93_9APHY
MAGKRLEFLSVSPRMKHTATVIFIHGLGDTGFGWQPLAEFLGKDPQLDRVKWILPHAPRRHIPLRNDTMPAWYDFVSLDPPTEVEADILESAKAIDDLIDDEIERGTPADRIVLGGFSQGAAMTLLTGLTTQHQIAGLIVLSGRLPMREKFKTLPISSHVQEYSIFWGHGTGDKVVTYELGVLSADYLKTELGIKPAGLHFADPSSSSSNAKPIGIDFHSYEDLGHTVTDEEVEDIRKFLKSILPNPIGSA